MDSIKLLIRSCFLLCILGSYFWVYSLVRYENLLEENEECSEFINLDSSLTVSHPAHQGSIEEGRGIRVELW